MWLRRVSTAVLSLGVLAATAGFTWHPQPSWDLKETGVEGRLRGLSVVSSKVVWASGSLGTVIRTTDGGSTWQSVGPPGTEALQFRDIEAFDAKRAVILSIGNGEDSRVYRTDDGGTTWTETFRNTEPTAFYDCMAFLDKRHGLALSDPVDGKFRIAATDDGGRSWEVLPNDGMPVALAGEFAFAASGTCLVAKAGRAWFATGGGATARVFRSDDRGRTWRVADSPVPSGEAAGIFSLAFADRHRGVAVGGDFLVPDAAPDGSAYSRDGGRTWTTSSTVPGGYRSGADWVTGHGPVLAVGPTGSDISWDAGRTWRGFDDGSFDAVQCEGFRACYASGELGRVAKLSW
jgi:photosystem II stability/assembly factor-like uncharacterized protein